MVGALLRVLAGTWTPNKQFRNGWLPRTRPVVYQKSKSMSHYDRRSVGQFVLVSCTFRSRCPDVTFIWVAITFFIFQVGRSLWREDGSVISSAMKQVQFQVTLRPTAYVTWCVSYCVQLEWKPGTHWVSSHIGDDPPTWGWGEVWQWVNNPSLYKNHQVLKCRMGIGFGWVLKHDWKSAKSKDIRMWVRFVRFKIWTITKTRMDLRDPQ
jgi:hypothetical protein